MKFLLLIFLCSATCLYAGAQSNDWFKGTWLGEKTFPDSRIARKVLLRMEIDAIQNNRFSGQLIYMYPADTTARLIRKIGGELYGKYVLINKSEEIYRMDPRSRGFWSDCSHCPGMSSFYIDNGDLVLQITASACGDSCNGQTTFRRKIEDFNIALQQTIVKKFAAGKVPVPDVSYRKTDSSFLANKLKERRDSLKLFPALLNDSMRVNFDPGKYVLPNAVVTDAILTPKEAGILHKSVKKNSVPQHLSLKDSMALNKNEISDSIMIAAKAIAKDSVISKNKTSLKDTIQTASNAINKNLVNTSAPKSIVAPKDTIAAVSGPAKNEIVALSKPVNDTVATLSTTARDNDTVPAAITERTTKLITTYQVSSPHIAVQLFDDGQIDGDAVSVFYNGKVIINNQTLTHKAITFNLEASVASRHHEFILISESEGFLPPNTALMRIKAGNQQFELTVSSSSARNAKIEINYVGE